MTFANPLCHRLPGNGHILCWGFCMADEPSNPLFQFGGILSEALAWLMFAVALLYVVQSFIWNTRILYRVQEKGRSERNLAVMALAFVVFPGSVGLFVYLLSGKPAMTIPFNVIMLLSIPYYYLVVCRLMSQQRTVSKS